MQDITFTYCRKYRRQMPRPQQRDLEHDCGRQPSSGDLDTLILQSARGDWRRYSKQRHVLQHVKGERPDIEQGTQRPRASKAGDGGGHRNREPAVQHPKA